MSETINLITNSKVTKKDFIFDFKELYGHTEDWLKWRQFTVIESKYVEKVGPNGKSYEIHWITNRSIDTYSQYNVDIIWTISDMNDIPAEIDGKKLILQKGSIEFNMSAYLVVDKEDKWENQPWMRLFKGFFDKFIYKSTMNRMKTELWQISTELQAEVKSFLELYRYNQ
tara:strand:- start:745 stop:1254 length:510 start_codon:yes stop_codon:yes gene_type:complete